MKHSFSLSVLVSVFSASSLYASEHSEDLERVPLLEHGNYDRDFNFNPDFAFNAPRIEQFTPISSTVPLERLCQHFKAGSPLGADYAELKKKGKFDNGKRYLQFLTTDDKWIAIKAEVGSKYITKLYCGEPSHAYAQKLIMNELHKSQGGSKVDVSFWNKIYKLYSHIFTFDLCLEFIKAEQLHRYNYNPPYHQWNYNQNFVQTLIRIYPDLADDIGAF